MGKKKFNFNVVCVSVIAVCIFMVVIWVPALFWLPFKEGFDAPSSTSGWSETKPKGEKLKPGSITPFENIIFVR